MTIERMCAELSERGYRGTDYIPHDAKAPSLETGRTRIETMFALRRKAQLVPDHTVMDGINAGRLLFPVVWFDAIKCAEGIEALRQYRADWDEKKRTFVDAPHHATQPTPSDILRWRGAMRGRRRSASRNPCQAFRSIA
jgi:phage terminase large subunit